MEPTRSRVWEEPAGPVARALLVLAALLLAAAYLLPLWNLTMFAPQYGSGLRMDIYSHVLQGGNGGQDLKEINLLNHYIGMRELAPDAFPEFVWLPVALLGLAIAFLRAALLGTLVQIADAVLLHLTFSAVGLWTFWHRLWSYGHELAPNAPVKVPPFMPPVFGRQQIANFEVYSYPGLGSWALALVAAALVASAVLAVRSAARRHRTAQARAGQLSGALVGQGST